MPFKSAVTGALPLLCFCIKGKLTDPAEDFTSGNSVQVEQKSFLELLSCADSQTSYLGLC